MLKKIIEQASDLEAGLYLLWRSITENGMELDSIKDRVKSQEEKAHELWKALVEFKESL